MKNAKRCKSSTQMLLITPRIMEQHSFKDLKKRMPNTRKKLMNKSKI